MRIVLASVSFLAMTAAGYISAAVTASEFTEISALSSSLEDLSQHILKRNEGFTEAILSSGINKKCVLFEEILSLSHCEKSDIFTDAVMLSSYPDKIKNDLIFLFSRICSSDFNSISGAFELCLDNIRKEEDLQKSKRDKNAPLYRKAGIISGLATAILVL